MTRSHLTFPIAAGSLLLPITASTLLLVAVGCHTSGNSFSGSADGGGEGIETYIAGARALDDGDTDKATHELSDAAHKNPNLIMPHVLLGHIYLDKADYGSAEVQYQTLARLDPYTESNFYNLGLSQQFLDKLKESAANYLRALDLSPEDAKACTNLGVVYLSLNQTDDAVKYLDRATKLDDKSWYAWASFGIALDRQTHFPQAELAYRKSLELDPSQTATLYNLGSNLITQNRPSEAIEIFQSAIKRDNSARYHKRLADALALSNRSDRAIDEYHTALRLDPRYCPALNDLGVLLITQYQKEAELDDDKKNSAVDLWRQSLAISPDQNRIKSLLKQWEAHK